MNEKRPLFTINRSQFTIHYSDPPLAPFPPNYVIIHPMTIEKVVRKVRLDEQENDFVYWQTQSYQARLAALEQIRQEYHHWKYDTEPRFQRVHTIVKQ